MTKKEMVYEIISNTRICGLNERDVKQMVNKNSKDYIEKIYNEFKKDKEHALFYYGLIERVTLY